MKIESVRALKAEVSEQILGPVLREAQAVKSFGLATGPTRRLTGAQRGIALGIAKGSSESDYHLAVRLQRRTLEEDTALRQRLEKAAHRELDIRYVGRIIKRAADTPSPVGPPMPWHRERLRPLLIGCSVGHFAVTAGSLGGFFLHRKTRRAVILSNNHVLANENKAKIGDAVLQPGSYDGGRRTRDKVGDLLDLVPLKTAGANLVDAAIAHIGADVDFDARSITGFGQMQGLRDHPIEPGDPVVKVGRTTGLTRGTVTAIELDDVVVEYDKGAMSFDRQIEVEGSGITAFSSGGDSGSLIFDAEGRACALLFAGSDQGGRNGKGLTNANDLTLVLEYLNLELALDAIAD